MFVRNKWLMLFILTTILLISACGNSESSNDEETSSSESDSEVEEDDSNELGDDQTVYPDEETSSSEREAEMDEANNSEQTNLSDALEKEEILIKVAQTKDGEIERRSNILRIYSFKDGKVSHYDTEGVMLEDIVDMSNDEIIEYAIDNLVDSDRPRMDDSEYKFELTPDGSGNNTEEMNIYYEDNEGIILVEFEINFENMKVETKIYDQHFEGFKHSNNNVNLIRVDEKSLGSIKLDDPDTDKEDIIVQ